ncbi:hypothetical protein WAF17_03960 [Bernardetia sp. ABR2-2B]|uniref:hypothetical protein n=1 Tax=Bernardetia sp. ABR2-2B TaxID=3127472 RepID=UPI0030D025BF
MKNILLPNSNFTIETSLTSSQILERIEKEVNAEIVPLKIAFTSFKEFAFNHSDQTFTLKRQLVSKSPIQKVEGKLIEEKTGTKVQIVISVTDLTKLFMLVWFAIFILALCVSFVISEKTLLKYDSLYYTSIAYIIFPISLLMTYLRIYVFKREVIRILKGVK